MSPNPLYLKIERAIESESPVHTEDIAAAFKSDDQYVQWMGCKAAGISENEAWIDWLVPFAVARVPNNDPNLNTIAVWSLAKIGGRAKAVWQMYWTSQSAEYRRMAADLIGKMRDLDGIPALTRLVEDPIDEVASWAVLSAAKCGSVSIDFLSEALARAQEPRRFLYCADALLKIDPNVAWSVVEEVLANRDQASADQLLRLVVLRAEALAESLDK